MKRSGVLILSLVLLGLSHRDSTSSCIDYGAKLRVLSRIPSRPECHVTAVAQHGVYGFAAGWNHDGRFLWTFDLTDTAAPRLVSSLNIPSNVWQIKFAWPYAYLASTYGMMEPGYDLDMVDLTNPEAPVLLEGIPANWEFGFEIQGDLLLTLSEEQLTVFSLADPAHPAYMSHVPSRTLAYPYRLALNDGYAYVLGGGLTIIDLRQAREPVIVGTEPLPSGGSVIATDGAWAFVANQHEGALGTYDLSDPSHPVLVARVPCPASSGIVVRNGRAYLDMPGGGFTLYDVTDPRNPRSIGNYGADLYCMMAPGDASLFAAWPDSRFEIIGPVSAEPATPASRIPQGDFSMAQHVAAYGRLAFHMKNDRVRVFDTTNPLNPVALGAWPMFCHGMAFADHFACVLEENRLDLCDIENPRFPVVLRSLPIAWGMDISWPGRYAYLAVSDGLKVVDTADPGSFAVVGSAMDCEWAVGVAADSAHAYVADSRSGLRIYDVTDPARPNLLTVFPTGAYTQDVILEDSLAYVLDLREGLLILNVADPSNPVVLSRLEMPSVEAYKVDRVGTMLYLANDYSGLAVVDVADPAHPRLIGSAAPDPDGRSYDVAAGETCVVTADGFPGVSLFPLYCPGGSTPEDPPPRPPIVPLNPVRVSTPLALDFEPNPVRQATTLTFALPGDDQVDLDVFDAAGRQRDHLELGVLPKGLHRRPWTTSDESGASLPGGTYFLRLRTGSSGAVTRKVLVIR